MEKLRIGFMNPFFYPFMGGTEKVLYEIGWRMAKRGHTIDVYTARHDLQLKPNEDVKGMNVSRVDADIIWNAPAPLVPPFPMFKRFNETTREFSKGVDILHINNRFIFSYTKIKYLSTLKPVTLTIHNAAPQNIDFLTDTCGSLHDALLVKTAYGYISGITSITKAALDMTFPDYKGLTRVIWNGVDIDIFRVKDKRKISSWKEIPQDKPIVMTNGRLVKQKGFEYLIKAMKGLDARLIIFGRGPIEKELRALAAKEGVDVIFITKTITEEELCDLINISDIFVLPSLYETFGVVVAEAMACGKPVAVSRIHGLPEVVEDTGLLFEPRSAESIRSSIEKLLADEKLRKALGKKARKRAEECFSWDRIVPQYEEFFRDVLNNKK